MVLIPIQHDQKIGKPAKKHCMYALHCHNEEVSLIFKHLQNSEEFNYLYYII